MMNNNNISDEQLCVDTLRDVLLKNGRLVLKPHGNSMGPLYNNASSIVIEPVSAMKISVGAVILFPRGDYWVAHRVVWRFRSDSDICYLTCGDAAGCLDSDTVTHSMVIGEVCEVHHDADIIDLRSAGQRFRAVVSAIYSLVSAILCHPVRTIRRRGTRL